MRRAAISPSPSAIETRGLTKRFGPVLALDGLDLRVRPVFARRSFDGRWQGQFYEAAVRYERPGRIGFRLEAGD